jgi:ATP-dependent Clp protease ATP-binding subunit ClpA
VDGARRALETAPGKTPLASELPGSTREIPFSVAVQRLLNDAVDEADRLGQHQIRPQHLLLAVLRTNSRDAASLRDSGVTDEQLESDATAAAAIDDKPLRYNFTFRLEVGQRLDSFRNE